MILKRKKRAAKGLDDHAKNSVCILGTGVMGRVLTNALVESQVVDRDDVWGVARSIEGAKEANEDLGIECFAVSDDVSDKVRSTNILVLAVKPNQVERAVEPFKRIGLKKGTLVISVVTGVSITKLQSLLGSGVCIVRAVTNTPCTVRQGMTALSIGAGVSDTQRELTQRLFQRVGRVIEIEESLCEAFTGLSASGPAYIYLIIEALADGGVSVGIPRDLALETVAQTVLGAAMMVKESGRHPASLRDDVTTPAGCTIGALMMLEDGKIRSTLAHAVAEATRIAKGLGKKE